MSSQHGAAEIGWVVWGTPANFNGFRVLAALLRRRRSTKASQTLHRLWPSPGLVHYVFIFGGSCPVTEFCYCTKFTLRASLALSYIGASAKLCGVEQRAPPICGRAAITLGISTPQSSADAHYQSNAAKTRKPLKFAGVPQTTEPISAVSRPKFAIL